jgi:Osmosensitive K+ channel His kinase sensor domain
LKLRQTAWVAEQRRRACCTVGSVSEVAADAAASGEVEPTGHFRIYLGAAPGVGKTFGMLSEGHRRQERDADVVVGFAEAYGRPHTEALINGLELIPRQVVEYRGKRLEEMDLGAILRRRPGIALVDELAHTNVPGSGPHENAGRMCWTSSAPGSTSSARAPDHPDLDRQHPAQLVAPPRRRADLPAGHP